MTSEVLPEKLPAYPPRKLLIQMSGAPGSGKSTTAKLLQEAIGAVVIDHDVIKSSLLDDESISFQQAAKASYRLQWTLAESLIKQQLSVIIDCTCNYREIVDKGNEIANTSGYEYWYIECRTKDIALLDQRLQSRIPLRSQRTGVDQPPVDSRGAPLNNDSVALFTKWMENPSILGADQANVIVVNSSDTSQERRDQILAQIYNQQA